MSPSHRNRLFLLVLTVLALASTIGARLYDLQVRRCDDLRARVKNQAQRTVEVNAVRGSILDPNGDFLAWAIIHGHCQLAALEISVEAVGAEQEFIS